MIFTDRTIIVQKGISSINDTIILYRGDKGVEIRFTLNEGSPFRFGSGASPNIIEKTEAAYGQLIIKTPNDLPSIFSEIAPTNEGKIIFTITAEMIDEITEVGNYTFQIRLLDESRNSRATLPEVVNGIEIREPIATEDVTTTNEVGIATVGYALTTAGVSEDTFDGEGNYNKTTWGTGDRITAPKLNKMEAAIDGVNKKVASGGTGSNNAGDISITDTGNYFTATDIEGALQEAGSQIKDIANKKIDDITLDNNVLTLLANSKTIKTITLPSTGGSGSNAREIELQASTDYIQWRYVGDGTWNNLVPLSDLKGAKGDKGETGATPNLQIGTVETLASGSSATASITGTTENPLLNLGIPKGENGTGGSSDTLVTTNISGTTLSLTTDKYQTTTVVDGTEITLPTVTSFTEIHLFFGTTTDLTLILPSCKWQNGNTPTISANKTYEFIFTYTTEWLGGVIQYE